jgi:hypothetical protein
MEGLDSEGDCLSGAAKSVRSELADIFSDLNQWMLKLLLAPELPDNLLSVPRGQYRNASQLARAANVSVMSAFRLVQQLQRDGYLHESELYLNLVRREDLFKRWQAASARRVKEFPMRFVLCGDPQVELDTASTMPLLKIRKYELAVGARSAKSKLPLSLTES